MSNAFLQAIKVRRSIYAIGSHLPISEDKITEIVIFQLAKLSRRDSVRRTA